MAVRYSIAAGGWQSYDPLAIFRKKKKKKEGEAPKPEPKPPVKDIGKRYYKDKPAEYFQPSTGLPVSIERARELAEPRGYTFGQHTGLTREEFEKLKRAPPKKERRMTPEQAAEAGLIPPEEMPQITEPAQEEQIQEQIQGGFVEKYLWTGAPTKEDIFKGTEAFAMMFGLGAVKGGWKVGGKFMKDPKKVVQVGTAIKNTAATKAMTTKIRDISVAMTAGLFGAEKISNLVFNRKVDEQQQALNTLGQITSTVIGDSTTGAGDWRKGLQELRHLREAVLQIERDIKNGEIAERTLEFRGKTYDINADVYDQLATIDEGIRDIQSFALAGQFPELSNYELQAMVRQLELEGHIDPVELTTARREME